MGQVGWEGEGDREKRMGREGESIERPLDSFRKLKYMRDEEKETRNKLENNNGG